MKHFKFFSSCNLSKKVDKTLFEGSYVCEAQTTHDEALPQATEVIVWKRIKVT